MKIIWLLTALAVGRVLAAPTTTPACNGDAIKRARKVYRDVNEMIQAGRTSKIVFLRTQTDTLGINGNALPVRPNAKLLMKVFLGPRHICFPEEQ